MTREDSYDDLLWEMSRADEAEEATNIPALDDETLRAWRDGRLEEAESRAVEAALAASPAARERLVALADLEAQAPPPALRRRVLRSFEPSASASASNPLPFRPRWWLPVVGLAATLLVALGLVQVWRGGAPAPLPDDLAFDVAVRGLASVRSAEAPTDGPETVEAHPETRLRFEVTPRGAAVAGLDFALYRERTDGALERVADRDAFRVERGAATLAQPAAELIGSEPGRHTLHLVVARQGDLPPPRLDPAAGEAPTRLAADGRRLVYPRSITLIPSDSDAGTPDSHDTPGGPHPKETYP